MMNQAEAVAAVAEFATVVVEPDLVVVLLPASGGDQVQVGYDASLDSYFVVVFTVLGPRLEPRWDFGLSGRRELPSTGDLVSLCNRRGRCVDWSRWSVLEAALEGLASVARASQLERSA